MLFVLLRKMMLREKWPNKVGYVIFFGQLMVVAVFSLVFALAKTTLASAGVDPAWFASPPWEWLLLISMTIWMGGMLVMARPDLMHIRKNKRESCGNLSGVLPFTGGENIYPPSP